MLDVIERRPCPNLISSPPRCWSWAPRTTAVSRSGKFDRACVSRRTEIFPKMGHDMMLEPGWEAVAERIHEWLETRDLGG
jgi:hypothetical protein